MILKGMNLCDYCFAPVQNTGECNNCGLNKNNYNCPADLLAPGTNLLGKYIIGRVLGRGGFGATYLAYSSERSETVAIKEYFPNGTAYRAKGEEKMQVISEDKKKVFQKGAKRFFNEAKTMSRFNANENVVSVYEFFYANDTVYYSMEYLDGIDFKGYIDKKGKRINEAEAITIMLKVCDALVAIHSTGTLHRDISPDNIFICTDGRIKLIDFGAAKQVIGEQSQSLSVILKQGFAPIEQYQTEGKQGFWTDIYSLGATIYYSLTGKIPMDPTSRIDNPEITFDPELYISPQFAAIINKCMKIKYDERYMSALELMDALKALNRQPVKVGGTDYRQSVYHGNDTKTGTGGRNVTFDNVPPVTPVSPAMQIPPVPNQQVISQYIYTQNEARKRSNLTKRVLIGAGAFVVLAIVIFLIVMLTRQPMMPPMPQPPPYNNQQMYNQPPNNMMPPGGM